VKRLLLAEQVIGEGVTIHLKPETEALIERRLQSGDFSSPKEVIERALEILRR
jgi:Arc/MetJ-type ribon-helix-helix transcriptional regulator